MFETKITDYKLISQLSDEDFFNKFSDSEGLVKFFDHAFNHENDILHQDFDSAERLLKKAFKFNTGVKAFITLLALNKLNIQDANDQRFLITILAEAMKNRSETICHQCVQMLREIIGIDISLQNFERINFTIKHFNTLNAEENISEIEKIISKIENVIPISLVIEPDYFTKVDFLCNFISNHGQMVTTLNLKYLKNQITDDILKYLIKKCVNLKILIVKSNRITTVNYLKNLYVVFLGGCTELTCFPNYSNLPKLNALELPCNKLDEVSIDGLSELEGVLLSKSEKLEKISLNNLINFKSLFISAHKIKELFLNNLPVLEELYLSRLSELRELKLNGLNSLKILVLPEKNQLTQDSINNIISFYKEQFAKGKNLKELTESLLKNQIALKLERSFIRKIIFGETTEDILAFINEKKDWLSNPSNIEKLFSTIKLYSEKNLKDDFEELSESVLSKLNLTVDSDQKILMFILSSAKNFDSKKIVRSCLESIKETFKIEVNLDNKKILINNSQFKFIPALNSIIKELNNLFELSISIVFKENTIFSFNDLIQITKENGNLLKRLCIIFDALTDNMLEELIDHCLYIEDLIVRSTKILDPSLNKLTLLKHLSLSACSQLRNLDLSQLTHLENVSVRWCKRIEDLMINKSINPELDTFNCEYLSIKKV